MSKEDKMGWELEMEERAFELALDEAEAARRAYYGDDYEEEEFSYAGHAGEDFCRGT